MPKVEEPNDPKPPDQKVWEQIDEILQKDERRRPEPIRIAKPTAPRPVRRSGTPLWYPTPEKLIVAGLALMAIAAITRRFILPLTLAGFALAGIGYYMLVVRKRRAKYGYSSSRRGQDETKYWRGKRVTPASTDKKRDGKILEFPDPKNDKDRDGSGREG